MFHVEHRASLRWGRMFHVEHLRCLQDPVGRRTPPVGDRRVLAGGIPCHCEADLDPRGH